MKPTMTIDEHGNKFWLLNGNYHREDGPAVERANGTKYWYLDGKLMTEEEHADQMFIKWCTTKIEYTG